MSETWKEVTGANFFKFEKEGDSVEGKFVEMQEGNFGKTPVLKAASGEKMVIPNLRVLMTKFDNIEIGTEVKVTYIGEKQAEKSGRTYKDFKVETK